MRKQVLKFSAPVRFCLISLRCFKYFIHDYLNKRIFAWHSSQSSTNFNIFIYFITAWKVSKYGVISGLNFPVFGLNKEISYSVRIQENMDQKWLHIWTLFTQLELQGLSQTFNANIKLTHNAVVLNWTVFSKQYFHCVV